MQYGSSWEWHSDSVVVVVVSRKIRLLRLFVCLLLELCRRES